jgi:hypothetical protein
MLNRLDLAAGIDGSQIWPHNCASARKAAHELGPAGLCLSILEPGGRQQLGLRSPCSAAPKLVVRCLILHRPGAPFWIDNAVVTVEEGTPMGSTLDGSPSKLLLRSSARRCLGGLGRHQPGVHHRRRVRETRTAKTKTTLTYRPTFTSHSSGRRQPSARLTSSCA